MLRAYKYRIYPNKGQRVLINKTLGACRLIYNLALETKINAWQSWRKNLSGYDLQKQFTSLRKDYDWLRKISSVPLYLAILNLDAAYKSFHRGNGFPKFKNKRSTNAYTERASININWALGLINIPKIKNIPIVLSREFNGKIKQATISKTPTGKYFISILVQDGKELPTKPVIKQGIGIDLGLKHFAITSDGRKFDNPKYLRISISHLKFLQRQVSKKKKGSSNRCKAVHKLALQHEKISNQRKDFLHKLSSTLIRDNQTLCFEDLNISGMVKNHNLAQSISDAGWSEFISMCQYKADWYGKNILFIPTFQPSTKVCSTCGCLNDYLTLADREWICICGTRHDRDINASINIKNFALKNCAEAQREKSVELPVLYGAMKRKISITKYAEKLRIKNSI